MGKQISRMKNELDYAATALANKVLVNKVILPEEFEKYCKDFAPSEKEIVKKKLQALGIELNDAMLVVTKKMSADEKIKEKDLLSFLIRPEYVDTAANHVQIGAQFYEGIMATGFPANVNKNWLGKLIKERGNVDFTLHLQPSSVRALEVFLNSQLKQVENDLYKFAQKGLHNPSLENRKKELLDQLNSIIRGDYKLYRMSLYLASKGFTTKESHTTSQRIMSSLNAEGIEANYAKNYQEQLVKSIIPAATDLMKEGHILVPGPAAAASFPLSSSFYDPDEEDGILLGFNNNGIPLVKSLWRLPKYIGAVLGTSGSGKSYASKAFLLNDQLVHGTKMFILDPEGEYLDMARAMYENPSSVWLCTMK